MNVEQAVIGALLKNNDALDGIDLRPEQIADVTLREIYSEMLTLANDRKPFDAVSIADSLEKSGRLDNCGGIGFLASLQDLPTAANLKYYARMVREQHEERRLQAAAHDIADIAADRSLSLADRKARAESALYALADDHKREGAISIKDSLRSTIDELQVRFEAHGLGEMIGIPTGINDLDSRINGMRNGDMVVIAGRPSMGKTALAMNIAEHVGLDKQIPVGVFSLEMPHEQLTERMIAAVGKVPLQEIRNGNVSDDSWPFVTAAGGRISKAPIFIDDQPGLSIFELRTRARRMARKHGVKLIIVDYMQLIEADGENRTQQVGTISKNIKGMAKELEVPVLVLSQLNRSLENRVNKRPIMSDLRESGAIEQDADIIAFVYRDEVYNEDSPDKGTAEIIIGKHRNGEPGTVRVQFAGQFSRFHDLEIGWQPRAVEPKRSFSNGFEG